MSLIVCLIITNLLENRNTYKYVCYLYTYVGRIT